MGTFSLTVFTLLLCLQFAPGIVNAQNPIEARKATAKTLTDSLRSQWSLKKAELTQEKKQLEYELGKASVKDVVDASLELLRLKLKSGPGRHATQYDAQIAKLQEAVNQRISLGTSGENDLREVLDARLDVMVAKIMLETP
jgi:hypothetical protein